MSSQEAEAVVVVDRPMFHSISAIAALACRVHRATTSPQIIRPKSTT